MPPGEKKDDGNGWQGAQFLGHLPAKTGEKRMLKFHKEKSNILSH